MHYRASVTNNDTVLQVRGLVVFCFFLKKRVGAGGRRQAGGASQKALWIEDCTGSLLCPPQKTREFY